MEWVMLKSFNAFHLLYMEVLLNVQYLCLSLSDQLFFYIMFVFWRPLPIKETHGLPFFMV